MGILALSQATVGEQAGWFRDALAVATATNLVLAFFNMIPIPPLDGSKVFASLLPERLAGPYLRLGRYGFLPLLVALLILPLLALVLGAIFH
jgi:Zn-dependent protease